MSRSWRRSALTAGTLVRSAATSAAERGGSTAPRSEYLRAFLGERLGWRAVNGLLIVSGAFGVFHRDTVVAAGGFRADVIGEDMELIVRLHRTLSARGTRYRVTFVPDPVCWTEAPEDFGTLGRQRKRWQRGLGESLRENRKLCFARGSGAAGWFAFPYFVVFELLSPLIEVGGLVVMAMAFALGMMSGTGFLAFMAAAFALGLMLSTTSILLEELSFHTYPNQPNVSVRYSSPCSRPQANRPYAMPHCTTLRRRNFSQRASIRPMLASVTPRTPCMA